jgi:hypothetical protein
MRRGAVELTVGDAVRVKGGAMLAVDGHLKNRRNRRIARKVVGTMVRKRNCRTKVEVSTKRKTGTKIRFLGTMARIVIASAKAL